MKRLSTVIVLALLLLTGCAGEAIPEMPNTMPPSVMIEGVLYQSTGRQLPGEVDPSAIAGSIAGVVPGSELPTEDYQSNCGEVGMNYAFVEEGLAVLLANEWTLFEPAKRQ